MPNNTPQQKQIRDKTPQQVIWQEFNGLADSLWRGAKGTFYKFVGLDARSVPGSITSQQSLAKDSGSTITEFCKVGLNISDGSKLFFSSTSGKIWYTAGNGTYSLVYTVAPSSGNAGCLGAYEYNGNIYWATQNYLHKVATVNVATFSGVTANWQAFTNGNATYHPMAVNNNNLFIGDGANMAKVDSTGTFTESSSVLVIGTPFVITSMIPYDIDMVIGTIISTDVNYCQIIRWDTIQTTWQFAEPVWENGINALWYDGSKIIANAGTYGKLYAYSGNNLVPYKRVPGTFSPTATIQIFPYSNAMWNGLNVFGVSQITGNPCDQAVYGLGSYDKKYPEIMSEDFPISSGNFSNIQIGAVLADGLNLYVAWWDNNGTPSYGVDKLNWSAKYASGYLETLRITPDMNHSKTTAKFFADYQNMPASCSLTLKHKIDNATSYTNLNDATLTFPTTDDTLYSQVYAESSVDMRAIQFRVEFNVSGNTAPVVEHLGVTFKN